MAGDRRQVADAVLVNGSTMPGPTTDKPMRSPDENGFSIGLSSGPPLGAKAPSGSDAWSEIASVGVSLLRYYPTWPSKQQDLTRRSSRRRRTSRLRLDILFASGSGSTQSATSWTSRHATPQRDRRVVEGRTWARRVEGGGRARARRHPRDRSRDRLRVRERTRPGPSARPDPGAGGPRRDVPLTAEAIAAYSTALDITGVDIFPVSYPPGKHAARRTRRSASSATSCRSSLRPPPASPSGRRCRSPGVASSRRRTCRDSRACARSASWHTRRSSREHAASTSSAETPRGDVPGRRESRLELDVLVPGGAPADLRAQLPRSVTGARRSRGSIRGHGRLRRHPADRARDERPLLRDRRENAVRSSRRR